MHPFKESGEGSRQCTASLLNNTLLFFWFTITQVQITLGIVPSTRFGLDIGCRIGFTMTQVQITLGIVPSTRFGLDIGCRIGFTMT